MFKLQLSFYKFYTFIITTFFGSSLSVLFFPIFILLIILIFTYLNQPNSRFKNIVFILFASVFTFYLAVYVFFSNSLSHNFYFHYEIEIFSFSINKNISTFAIDNFNIFFLLLLSFLFPLCLLINWNYKLKEFVLFVRVVAILEIFLIFTFISMNLLLFYIFFEFTLFPIFFIINKWGSRSRRTHASYMFFFYTVLGSIFLLLAIVILYCATGSLDLTVLLKMQIDAEKQFFLWILFFIGFAVKIPLPPFHLWLPEAHVEAPTAGSVLLAGIMLKLGGYGMLRFMVPLLPNANVYYSNFVHALCIFSIIYISILAIRQLDMKKAIAYSSIAHMSFVVVGIFSFNVEGLSGSIFLMIGHGIVSSALFYMAGLLYDRYKTRIITNYSNLTDIMPIFSFFFFFFTLANISFPFTVNFIGEFLILLGISTVNIIVFFILLISVIITSVYSLWLNNRILFNINFFAKKPFIISLKKITYFNRDLSKNEFIVLCILMIVSIFLGVQPNFILEKMQFLSAIYLSKY